MLKEGCQGNHCRALQAAPRGSGGTAEQTKEKYTLKSAGGGTYKTASGQQINVHASSARFTSLCLLRAPCCMLRPAPA